MSDNLITNQVAKMTKESIDVDPDQDQPLENIKGRDAEGRNPDRIRHRREETKTRIGRAIKGAVTKDSRRDMFHRSLINPSIIVRSQEMKKERTKSIRNAHRRRIRHPISKKKKIYESK